MFPLSKPPLIQRLAFAPIPGDTKLIAEAWDAGGLYPAALPGVAYSYFLADFPQLTARPPGKDVFPGCFRPIWGFSRSATCTLSGDSTECQSRYVSCAGNSWEMYSHRRQVRAIISWTFVYDLFCAL